MSKMINSADQIDLNPNRNAIDKEEFEELSEMFKTDNKLKKAFNYGRIMQMVICEKISMNQFEGLMKTIGIDEKFLDEME